jgi:hypothetical protein
MPGMYPAIRHLARRGRRALCWAHSRIPVQRALGTSRFLPAWPTVAAVQLAVLLGIAVASHAEAPDSVAPDVEDALVALDVPRAEGAVADAKAVLKSSIGARVLEADRAPLERSLGPVAARAGFQLTGVTPVRRFEEPGAQVAIECWKIALQGQVFALPQLFHELAGAGYLLAPTALEATRLSAGGSTMDLVLVVDAFVPRRFDVSWIAPRLERGLPGADRAAPVLVEAAELVSLRLLDEGAPELDALATERYDTLARLLPPALIRLRKTGGSIAWTSLGGLQFR